MLLTRIRFNWIKKYKWLLTVTVCFMRPARMLTTTEPVVFFFTLWISYAWGILHLFFSSVVQTFSENYNWSTLATGCVQLAISVGAVIGTAVNPVQDCFALHAFRRPQQGESRKAHSRARLYTSFSR